MGYSDGAVCSEPASCGTHPGETNLRLSDVALSARTAGDLRELISNGRQEDAGGIIIDVIRCVMLFVLLVTIGLCKGRPCCYQNYRRL